DVESSEYGVWSPAGQSVPEAIENVRHDPQNGCNAGRKPGGVGTQSPGPTGGTQRGGKFPRAPPWPPAVVDGSNTAAAACRPRSTQRRNLPGARPALPAHTVAASRAAGGARRGRA